MSLHHHHVFQFVDTEAVYFDGALVHDHDPLDHWDGGRYLATHTPLSGYVDDGRCIESTADCRWAELTGEEA